MYLFVCDYFFAVGGTYFVFVSSRFGPDCSLFVCVMFRVGALEDGMLPAYTAGSPGEWPAVALLASNSFVFGPNFPVWFLGLTQGRGPAFCM